MPSEKKPRTPTRSASRRQIEFTPGQMLIAICTFIAFGLVCFMLGILVTRLDSTLAPIEDEPTEQTAAAPILNREPQAQPAPAAPDVPRPQQSSPTPPENLRDQVASRNETPAPGQPRTVAPPPATRRPAPPTQPAPPTTPPPALPEAPPPPQPPAEPIEEPIAEDPAATPPPEAPPAADTPRVLENVEPLTPEPPAPPAEPRTGTAAFGVQIASVSIDRRDQAQRALSDAERRVGQSGRLVPTADGRMLRIIVGDFSDRAEATRLMESMRNESQFESCFVQSFTR